MNTPPRDKLFGKYPGILRVNLFQCSQSLPVSKRKVKTKYLHIILLFHIKDSQSLANQPQIIFPPSAAVFSPPHISHYCPSCCCYHGLTHPQDAGNTGAQDYRDNRGKIIMIKIQLWAHNIFLSIRLTLTTITVYLRQYPRLSCLDKFLTNSCYWINDTD